MKTATAILPGDKHEFTLGRVQENRKRRGRVCPKTPIWYREGAGRSIVTNAGGFFMQTETLSSLIP